MITRRHPAPATLKGAFTVCFNEKSKMDNPFIADLLVDAGIFVALFDQDDVWHDAVKDFFDTYYLNKEFGPKFYTTHDIINEYLNSINANYEKRTGNKSSNIVRRIFADNILNLVEDKALTIVDLNDKVIIEAINKWANVGSYGAKDVFHVLCSLNWGLDFITVDHKLMYILENDPDCKGRTVYYQALGMKK